jgi:hypothetical protein
MTALLMIIIAVVAAVGLLSAVRVLIGQRGGATMTSHDVRRSTLVGYGLLRAGPRRSGRQEPLHAKVNGLRRSAPGTVAPESPDIQTRV